MKRLERFQNNNYSSGNESLNSAYSGESLNIISNNMALELGNNTIADGLDRKLRDSVIVTIHTRNIGETF